MNNAPTIGHIKQQTLLRKLAIKNRLPHALMFSGPSGIGKKRVALELINSMYCEKPAPDFKPCRQCKSCQVFMAGNTADLKLINCLDKVSVNAENIRILLNSLNLNTFNSEKRIILIDNAEFLPVQSSNILLKSLEEPRNNTFFILISANPYRLPHTLLSRCQLIHFSSLNNSELQQILSENSELKKSFSSLTKYNVNLNDLSEYFPGSLENLEMLINNFDSWLFLRENTGEILRGNILAASLVSEKLSKNKENLRANLRLLCGIIRVAMHGAGCDYSREKLAVAVLHLIIAEKLILERNISASYVLNFILYNLANPQSCSYPADMDESISMLADC